MPSPTALIVSLNENLCSELKQLLRHDGRWDVEAAQEAAQVRRVLDRPECRWVFVDLHGTPPDDQVREVLEAALREARRPMGIVGIHDGLVPCRWATFYDHAVARRLMLPLEPGSLAQAMRDVPRPDETEPAAPLVPRVMQGKTIRYATYAPELFSTLDELELAATHDVTVLMVGETGTGKTYLARLVHELSPRHTERFLPVACGALPPDLIESELFGHVRGAFTGADRSKIGKFEAAEGGTLLLDEIDVLGPEQQAKLLRVIETSEFEPVGSNETRFSKARLIVASNLDLEAMIAKNRFRADLYYRLNVLQFYIPPLRKRKMDIVPLAVDFIENFSRRYGVPVLRLHVDFLAFLRDYPWPGNVRELENLMRRTVLFCRRGELSAQDLPPSLTQTHNGRAWSAAAAADAASPLTERVAMTEREAIERALRANSFKRARTARALGISRVTLYNKMKKYGMLGMVADGSKGENVPSP